MPEAMYSLSMAQLLILFDHILLAILFLIALFCVVAAVTASFTNSEKRRSKMTMMMMGAWRGRTPATPPARVGRCCWRTGSGTMWSRL